MEKKKHNYKGINYQSKGEFEIAKFLDEMNIEFEYEFPIAVIDEGKVKVWYPDFYLKEYQVVIEYFGMYEHNESYRENAEHKKKVFQNCGIQYVPMYKFNKNWKEYVLKNILSYLEIKTDNMTRKLNQIQKKNGFKQFFEVVFRAK